jgi:hypothetical protein
MAVAIAMVNLLSRQDEQAMTHLEHGKKAKLASESKRRLVSSEGAEHPCFLTSAGRISQVPLGIVVPT